MSDATEKSGFYFNSGYGCAESILMAVAESKGIRSDLIPRIATGFCGGIAHSGGMCGAVTGAVMAINLLSGRDHAGDSKTDNYQVINAFLDQFKARFEDLTCPGLTGVDLATQEGHDQYNDKGIHTRCTEFVVEATRLVLELDKSQTK